MKYRVKFSESFNKDFKKLDHYTQTMIIAWIDKHIDEQIIQEALVKH